MTVEQEPVLLGRREWVALPELGLPAVKAKIDTGARTSALHALDISPFDGPDGPRVRFLTYPLPERPDVRILCDAPLVGERDITSSMGETESRYIIETSVSLGDATWTVEVGLTNRHGLVHRMLLGRTAIPDGMLVDPRRSFLLSKPSGSLYAEGVS